MIKVKTSSHVGLTLRLFKDSQFEFIRPDVTLEIEIENEEEISEAINLAEKAIRATWDKNTELIDELVMAEMPKVNEKMEFEVGKKLQNFEKQLEDFRKILKEKK